MNSKDSVDSKDSTFSAFFSQKSPPNLITNNAQNTLFARLCHIIDGYENPCDLYIISAYFNAHAIAEMSEKMGKNLNQVHLIIGQESPKSATDDDFTPRFSLKDPFDLRILDLESQLDEIKFSKIASDFIKAKMKIYTLKNPHTLLHSKLYLTFDANNKNVESYAIIGSSNFTPSGLGLNKANKELNLLCNDRRDISECKGYFEDIKSECKDSSDKIAQDILETFAYKSPSEIFQHIHSHIYKIAPDSLQELDSSELERLERGVSAFGLYRFQKTASIELARRLKEYKVAILADPVGAGKTLSALGVMSIYDKNIVIITPPHLKAQWESYLNGDNPYISEFASFKAQILTYHEAQSEENSKNKAYLKNANLVIIDESHNFRNGPNKKRKNRYSKLKSNLAPNTPLLLLTATPINNSYEDLANQLMLVADKIKIQNKNLEPSKVCREAMSKAIESSENLLDRLPSDYITLTHTIFSRSPQDIENALLSECNAAMPEPKIAKLALSSIPKELDFSYKKLVEILGFGASNNPKTTNGISFCIYDPYKFLPEIIKKSLESRQLDNLGDYTTPKGFISMKMLKMLESSPEAFLDTLDKIINYHNAFLRFITESSDSVDSIDSTETEYSAESADFIESQDSLDLEDSINDEFPTRLGKLRDLDFIGHLYPSFEVQVRKDLEKLQSIKQAFDKYDRKGGSDFVKNEKFKKTIEIIESKITEKFLIFSESIRTANVLCEALKKRFPNLFVAKITGESDTKDYIKNKNLFSPKSLKYTLTAGEREIDILVATDTLSEGANLQDCNNVINWDLGFNPVVAIQRVGRIWRIGSEHKNIFVYHFFPDEIDNYIDLQSRLQHKTMMAQSTNETINVFDIQHTKEFEIFKVQKKAQYALLDSKMIALEDNKRDIGIIDYIKSRLGELLNKHGANENGIFSIVPKNDLGELKFAKNTIFAALKLVSNDKMYFVLDEPNAPNKDNIANQATQKAAFERIESFIKLENVPRAEFVSLEKITQDYKNLTYLKERFKKLINRLNSDIKELHKESNSSKRQHFQFTKKENEKFALVAFLIINFDANEIERENLNANRADSMDSMDLKDSTDSPNSIESTDSTHLRDFKECESQAQHTNTANLKG